MLTAAGCGNGGSSSAGAGAGTDLDLSNWDAVVQAARGTKVSFAGFGGMDTFNTYMQDTAIPYIKQQYDIDLEWAQFEVESDIVALVNNEKSGGKNPGEGTHDLIWITLDESAIMQGMGSMYEDIRSYIPNVSYIDPQSPGLVGVGDTKINVATVPWGPLTTVYPYNASKVSWTPKNAKEYLEWVKEYEGKMTFPIASEYGWSVWWPLLLDILGEDWWQGFNSNSSYEEVKTAMEPGLEYLREVNPYLWNKGKSYPSYDQLYEFFPSGEIWTMFMDTPYVLDTYVNQKVMPETSQEFIFEDIGLFNWWGHQIAIPYDCPNIAGAMVAMNALLEPEQIYAEMQETGYEASLDYSRLNDDQKKIADAVKFSDRCLSKEQLDKYPRYDPPASGVMDIVCEIWDNEVAGKYNS